MCWPASALTELSVLRQGGQDKGEWPTPSPKATAPPLSAEQSPSPQVVRSPLPGHLGPMSQPVALTHLLTQQTQQAQLACLALEAPLLNAQSQPRPPACLTPNPALCPSRCVRTPRGPACPVPPAPGEVRCPPPGGTWYSLPSPYKWRSPQAPLQKPWLRTHQLRAPSLPRVVQATCPALSMPGRW